MRLRWVAGWCGVGGEVDGVESVGAAQADGGVVCVVAYVFGEAPAAFAFAAFGGFGLNVEGALLHAALGNGRVGELYLGHSRSSGRTLS